MYFISHQTIGHIVVKLKASTLNAIHLKNKYV